MSLFLSQSVGIVAAADESTSGWTPANLSTPPLAWWDASNAGSVHATAGAVDSWDDLSGNSHTASASTTARPTTGTRTLNSLNVLDFNGTANRMTTGSFAITQPFTVAAVVLSDNGANSAQEIFCADITNQRSVNKATTNKWSMFDGNQLDSTVTVNTSGHYLICVFKTPSTAVISVGGTETTGNAGSGSWGGGISIGASNTANWWNGMLAELLIVNADVGSTDRATLGTYFHSKWGV